MLLLLSDRDDINFFLNMSLDSHHLAAILGFMSFVSFFSALYLKGYSADIKTNPSERLSGEGWGIGFKIFPRVIEYRVTLILLLFFFSVILLIEPVILVAILLFLFSVLLFVPRSGGDHGLLSYHAWGYIFQVYAIVAIYIFYSLLGRIGILGSVFIFISSRQIWSYFSANMSSFFALFNFRSQVAEKKDLFKGGGALDVVLPDLNASVVSVTGITGSSRTVFSINTRGPVISVLDFKKDASFCRDIDVYKCLFDAIGIEYEYVFNELEDARVATISLNCKVVSLDDSFRAIALGVESTRIIQNESDIDFPRICFFDEFSLEQINNNVSCVMFNNGDLEWFAENYAELNKIALTYTAVVNPDMNSQNLVFIEGVDSRIHAIPLRVGRLEVAPIGSIFARLNSSKFADIDAQLHLLDKVYGKVLGSERDKRAYLVGLHTEEMRLSLRRNNYSSFSHALARLRRVFQDNNDRVESGVWVRLVTGRGDSNNLSKGGAELRADKRIT